MTTHPIIQTLTDKIIAELTPVDREAAFDAMLDDCGTVTVAGMEFWPSAIIREMDPIAYRCGVNDYADGEPWVEIEGETYDQKEVESIAEEFKSDLESELSDLETELEEEEAETEKDDGRIEGLEQLIAEKRAEIEAIEKDDFFN